MDLVLAPGKGQVPSGTDRYRDKLQDSGTGDHISGPDPRETSQL